MDTQRLLASIRSWNIFDLLAPKGHVAETLAGITDENRGDLVALLRPTADTCAVEGKLSTMPNFMPRGNPYNQTGCDGFQEIGWLVGYLGLARDDMHSLFVDHQSREVRLAAGHFLLMYPGTAHEVSERAVEPARSLVGWFRLWIGALLAIDKTEAYVAIADRIATSTEQKPLLAAAMDAGWHAGVTDPRWGDLGMMALEQGNYRPPALTVLSQVKDPRVVQLLLEEIRHPDNGTASAGLAQLARVLDEPALLEALAPVIADATDKYRFESFFNQRQMTAGLELIEASRKTRATKIAKQQLPFLFFGAQPGDWYEGANDGHLYIMCFQGQLDAKAKTRLAKAIGRLPELSDRPWLWGELDGNTWAYFYCGGTPFEGMRKQLPAVHKAVKIREVIFGGLREESERDEWTIWSEQQGTAAKRVPVLQSNLATDMIWYFAGRELVAVPGVRDEAFEDAR